jgi:aminoglycoside phosphotransferase (APT) family kinase protein
LETTTLANRLADFLSREMRRPLGSVEVSNLQRLMGGSSAITTRFTATIDGVDEVLVLRADSDRESQLANVNNRTDEWRLLDVLTQSGLVPIPAALYCDQTGASLGSKGIVLRHVIGETLQAFIRRATSAELAKSADLICDLMAAIHRFPLADLPECLPMPNGWDDYLMSYLGLWRKVESEHIEPDPSASFMVDWLDYHRPAAAPFVLVHSDFSPANILRTEDGRLLAIDWEFSHVGDPREDLGWLMARASNHPPDLYGIDRERFLKRYRDVTGLDETIVNHQTVSYFSILSTMRGFHPVYEAVSAVARGTSKSLMGAYLGGAVSFEHRRWLDLLLEEMG